jgi:hypothetical protein
VQNCLVASASHSIEPILAHDLHQQPTTMLV